MHQRKAFTLIELLVVIAVIAILISILLPALGKARSAAQAVTAANTQRQLAIGAATYSTNAKQNIPGINTTGLVAIDRIIRNTYVPTASSRSDFPVQTTDWMSPAIGDDLPQDREARFATLLTKFGDPAQNYIASPAPADVLGTPAGAQEFWDYVNGTGNANDRWDGPTVPATSFLQPTIFQIYGGESIVDVSGGGAFGGGTLERVRRLGQDTVQIGAQVNHSYGGTTGTASLPNGYAPRIDKILAPSIKIYSATGTRYVDPTSSAGLVTTAGSYQVGTYGDFGSSGATFRGSTAYGDEVGMNPGLGQNLPFAYRHNGRMVVANWDTSTTTLSPSESRDPKYWWPSRSRFNSSDWEVVNQAYEPGDLIP